MNTSLKAGCFALTLLLASGATPSTALSQAGILVDPENPCEADSLKITVDEESLTFPVWIDSKTVEVSEGLIRITTDLRCGIMYMVEPYRITVEIPPVAPGTYDMEYWSNEDCHLGANPILTSEITVAPSPIATRKTTWGAIKALLR
jgi:hypothetical protein